MQTVYIRRVYEHELALVIALNEAIFGDRALIQHWEAEDLRMYIAQIEHQNVGFKVGYRIDEHTFYSAKGGVLPEFRRNGIAKALLAFMQQDVQISGYERFIFDTFPNKHPGMSVLALKAGFNLIQADFNPQYNDFRLRFEQELKHFQ